DGHVEKRKRQFENPPSISPEDFLSSLPDDCLLEVLKFSNRNALEICTHVNQRMHSIMQHRECQMNLRKFYTLSITQGYRCHALYLDPYSKEGGVTFAYKISTTMKQTKTRYKTRFIDKMIADNNSQEYPPLPNQVFECIRSIQAKYDYERLNIIQVRD
ncbi:hypothetical protein PMAYCL1PPCAC_13867, partial [Pristionchus mayeri]